jgi:hypothetical protein
MILALSIWYGLGALAWLIIRAVYCREVLVADVMFSLIVGVTGPIIPLTIGSWHLSVWLETMGRTVIWQDKK